MMLTQLWSTLDNGLRTRPRQHITKEQYTLRPLSTTKQHLFSKVGRVYPSKMDKYQPFSVLGIGIRVDSGRTAVIQGRVHSSYTIDGGSPTVYNATGQFTTEAYRSPTLANGQHTLTVTNLDNTGHLFGLDFFQVITPDNVVSTSSSSSSTTTLTTAISTSVTSNSSISHGGATSSTTTSSGFLGATTRGPDASSTPSPSLTTKPRDPSQIPLIVGPIFGAIVICGIIFLLLRHQRRKPMEADSRITWENYTPASKPFVNFLALAHGLHQLPTPQLDSRLLCVWRMDRSHHPSITT